MPLCESKNAIWFDCSNNSLKEIESSGLRTATRSFLSEKLKKLFVDFDFILQNHFYDSYKIIPMERSKPYKAENLAESSKVLFNWVPVKT